MSYLNKLKNIETPTSPTYKTIKSSEEKTASECNDEHLTNKSKPTVADFAAEHCTFAPDATVRGAALIMALTRWRRQVGVSDGTCTWDELAAHLEQLGCRQDAASTPAIWRGVGLLANSSAWPADDVPVACASDELAAVPVPAQSTPPDAVQYVTNPHTGVTYVIRLATCKSCGKANWGPKPDDPDTWWCLTCHPTADSAGDENAAVARPTPETESAPHLLTILSEGNAS